MGWRPSADANSKWRNGNAGSDHGAGGMMRGCPRLGSGTRPFLGIGSDCYPIPWENPVDQNIVSLMVSYALDFSYTLLPRTSRWCTGWSSVEGVQSRDEVHPSPGVPLWCAPLRTPQACAVFVTAQRQKRSGVSRHKLDDAPFPIGQPCGVTLSQFVHLRARQPSDHFGFARA